MPKPGLVALRVSLSSQPLKTHPNPPSPRRLLSLKFLVAFLSTSKEKAFRYGDDSISLSEDGIGNIYGADDGILPSGFGNGNRLVLLSYCPPLLLVCDDDLFGVGKGWLFRLLIPHSVHQIRTSPSCILAPKVTSSTS